MISKKEIEEWFNQSNDGWADRIIQELWAKCIELERENIALNDDLAIMHTLITDSYERRRASKYERD